MAIASTQMTIEIARISKLIVQEKVSDGDLEKAISDLDAIKSSLHQPQAFLLRCSASKKLSSPEKRIVYIWSSFENGQNLLHASRDPDLVLQLRALTMELEQELINSGLQAKVQALIQRNSLQN